MEAKLKHLDYIQAAIGRMATNSFLFKGWAITLAAALSGFAAVNTKAALLVIALLSTLLFWGLDGYYLWLERAFRTLYNTVAALPAGSIDFSMAIAKPEPAAWTWLHTCFRWHLGVFYGAILAMDIVGIFLVKAATDGS